MSDDQNTSIDDLKDLDNMARRVSERGGAEIDADDDVPEQRGAWERATNTDQERGE